MPYALCPMPYALCPMPYVTEKGNIQSMCGHRLTFFGNEKIHICTHNDFVKKDDRTMVSYQRH
jgi:hypothetical protein